MVVGVDFNWKDVVVGADLEAVEFAHDNKYFLIKNRPPHHHSYEETEESWAKKIYQLYNLGLVPFTNKANSIRIISEDKLIKVFTDNNVFTVQYENIHVFDFENVQGLDKSKELVCYRVVDWFDCRGLCDANVTEIISGDEFVRKIKLFLSPRIDGNHKHKDLLCESFLTEDQLKNFEFSDTMVRFKVVDTLKKHGFDSVKISLWKRDIYPVYKALF